MNLFSLFMLKLALEIPNGWVHPLELNNEKLVGGIFFTRPLLLSNSGEAWVKVVPGKSLGIVGQDPSDSKSNRLHADIFRIFFIHLKYIL
jgi:hypothetical protein